MNTDFLTYKKRFLTFSLLLGYVFIHVFLTGTYVDTTLDKEISFATRLPFGQRLLVPALAHFLVAYIPIQVDHLFFLLEWMFVALFYWGLVKLLEQEFTPQQSQLLGWLFLLLLPIMTVVNYRYITGGESTFFYPYDSASMFFLVVGFLLCLRQQWVYLIPWIFLSTFNRESAILLVLLIPALHWEKPKTFIWPLLAALLAYVIARCIVLSLLHGVPGQVMEWYFRQSSHTYFEVNLYWLLNMQQMLLFAFCFAGLPLFWFAFYDYIPYRYRPIRYVALVYFLGLALVGNFMEARLFSEIAVLLYFPVCLALKAWLTQQNPYPYSPGGLAFINRYLVLAVLAFVLLFRYELNQALLCFLQFI